jgi:hypothetical protein
MSDDQPEKKPEKKPAAKKPAAKKPAATKPVPVVAEAPTEVIPPVATPPADPVPPVDDAPPAPKKRRRWPWILGGVLVLLAILVTIALVVADGYAKDYARDYIKQRIIQVLGIEPGTPVTVDIGEGSVLLQALAGRLDSVDVTAAKVTFGELTGSAVVHAEGVPLDENAATRELQVEFAVAEADVAALAGNLSGMSLDSISLDEPEIVANTTYLLFGFVELEVGMGLEPSAQDGRIVFTPTSIRLNGESFTAEQLRQSFGQLADELLAQQSVCVDESLPVALTIVDVDVVKKELLVKIDGDGVVLGGPDLSTLGTCAG